MRQSFMSMHKVLFGGIIFDYGVFILKEQLQPIYNLRFVLVALDEVAFVTEKKITRKYTDN